MRMSPILLAVPALVLTAACAPPEAAPPTDMAAEAVADNAAAMAAVAAVSAAELAAISSGAVDVSYLADDAVMMPPNEPAIAGIDAIRTWVEAFIGQFSLSANYTQSNITVSGDWAFETYAGTLTLTPTAGGDAVTETIKGIHVYRKGADGMWKMVYDVWNSDAPPPQM